MQTPTLAEPEAAAAVEEAAVEAAVEEAAVEAEEPPQAVRTPVAPTTAEAFRKSRREIIFIILFSFINAYHSISQSALVTRFAVSVCIITIRPTVRNRTNRQDYLPYFVSVPQYILLYPKIFLLSSTILHICATSVQIYCVCAYFGNIFLCIDGFPMIVVVYYTIIMIRCRRTAVSRPPSTPYLVTSL